MKQNIKITKQDLKEDKFAVAMLKAKDQIVANWMFYAGGLAFLFVLVFGITFLKQEGVKKNTEATSLYNKGLSLYLNQQHEQAIVEFMSVIDDFGSAEIAEQAQFNLGNAYFGKKDFDMAISAFETYVKKYGGDDKYFTTSAIAGIAMSLESKGDPLAAAAKYQEAAERYPDFKLAGEYYLKAMKAYIAGGNLESAKEVYATMAKDLDKTSYYDDAMMVAGENGLSL
jgi:outer membrane protein assembly factor BamD (BamD/ComL family)